MPGESCLLLYAGFRLVCGFPPVLSAAWQGVWFLGDGFGGLRYISGSLELLLSVGSYTHGGTLGLGLARVPTDLWCSLVAPFTGFPTSQGAWVFVRCFCPSAPAFPGEAG